MSWTTGWPTKIVVASLLSLSFATQAHAGDVCSGVKTKNDKFGDGVTALAVVQPLSQMRMLGVMMESKSGNTTLTIKVKEGGALSGKVAAGTQLMFSMKSGDVLKLGTANDTALQSYVSGESVMTNVPYTLALTPDQLKVFAESDLDAVRLPIISTGTTYDWTANKGVQKKLRAAATCMQTLN